MWYNIICENSVDLATNEKKTCFFICENSIDLATNGKKTYFFLNCTTKLIC